MTERSLRRWGILLALLGVVLLLAGLWLRSQLGGYERVRDWMPEIRIAAEEAGVDPALLAGLVFAESRGRPDAVSSIGAMGLCQLLPSTAAEVAERIGVSGPPYSPQDNLRLGAAYLAQMTRRWDGREDLGVLSYRLGPARVSRQVQAAGSIEAWLDEISSRHPSPWGYLQQVFDLRQRFEAELDGNT